MFEKLIKRLNAYSAEYEHHGGMTAEAADAIATMNRIIDRQNEIINRCAYIQPAYWICLPVKLGDPVYCIVDWKHEIEEGHVSMLQQKADGTWKFRFSNSSSFDVNMDEIGKSVWLAREQAEQALKERMGDG